MSFRSFLKDKIILISLLLFGILTIEIFLTPYSIGNFIKVYVLVAIILLFFIGIFIEYYSKNKYYKNLQNYLDDLDEKYLITEIIKEPDFTEGKLLKEILQQIDKSMKENVNKYKYIQEEYKEYIELWIHEIKIPIASRENGNRE